MDESDFYVAGGGALPKQDCPCCGASEPEYFYLDEDEICIGCSECVYRVTELY